MSTRRLQLALQAIGQVDLFQKFEDEGMDDDALEFCMEDESSRNDLKKIFNNKSGILMKFLKAYKSLQNPESENVVGDQQPTASRLPVQSNRSFMTGQPSDDLNPTTPNSRQNTISQHKNGKLEPVQIIDLILKAQSGVDTRLVLKEDNLTQILQNVKNRRVAVLSIAGPSRQGKSFLLGYMIKYLRHVSGESRSSSWMGESESERNAPLREGFSWRNGVERETTGISMWPEPFTLTTKNGSEFDVLLVDTQGVFDHYTEEKDWATIVGLSLLTSSALIFNISKSLQEDSLRTLKGFMDFGLMAMDSSEGGEKPFQSLTFLIRDWNNASDYSYGARGGADFLEYQLNQKHTDSGGKIREQIKDSFEQLHCFLMPDPGENVKDKNYDGSVARMTPNFASNIKDFIETLFDPKVFPLMTISGNPVTGLDLLTYFKKYVEIFNSDKVPSSEDMNKAMTTICNQTVVNRCVAAYETQFDKLKSQVQRSFLLEKELEEFHNTASNEAIKIFDKSRKMGSKFEINGSKNELRDAKLKSIFMNFQLQNKEHFRAALDIQINKLTKYFEYSVTTEISAQATGIDKFLEDEPLEKILKNTEEDAVTKLQTNLEIPDLDYIKGQLESFSHSIKKIGDSVTKDNQIAKSQAESALKTFLQQLLQTFTDQLTKDTEHKFVKMSDFGMTLKSAHDTLKSEFSQKYQNSLFFDDGEDQLLAKTNEIQTKILEKIEGTNIRLKKDCSEKVNELEGQYELDMNSNNLIESFSKCHADAKNASILSFEGYKSAQKLPPEEVETFKIDLCARIDLKCLELARKSIKEKRARLFTQFQTSLQEYDQALDSQDTIVDDSALEQLYDEKKAKVSEDFQNCLCDILSTGATAEKDTTILSEIDNEAKRHKERFSKKNQVKYKTQVGHNFKHFAKAYGEELKEIVKSSQTEAEYHQKTFSAMEKIMEDFKRKCESSGSPPLSVTVLPPFLEELKAKLIENTEQELEVVVLRLQKAMNTFLEELLQSFSDQLTQCIQGKYVKTTEFDKIFCAALETTKLQFYPKYESSSFFKNGETHLLKRTAEMQSELLTKIESTNNSLKRDCKEQIIEFERQYEGTMSSAFESGNLLETFSNCEAEARNASAISFKNSKYAQLLPPEELKLLTSELTFLMDLKRSHIAQKSIKEKRVRLAAKFKNSLHTYDQRPDLKDALVNESILQQLYDEENTKILKDFQDFWQDILSTGDLPEIQDTTSLTEKELQSDIDRDIKLHLQSVLHRNQQLRLEFENLVKTITKQSADKFGKKLKEISASSTTEAAFSQKASQAVQETVEEAERTGKSSASPTLSAQVLPPFLEELRVELEKKKEAELEVVLLKIEQGMNNFIEDLLLTFSQKLTALTQGMYVTDTKFKEIFTSKLKATKSEFSKNYETSSLFKSGKAQLLKQTSVVQNETLKTIKSNREFLLMNCSDKMEHFEEKYGNDMSSGLECENLLSSFSKCHTEAKSAALIEFVRSESAQKLPSEEVETLKSELSSRLNLKCNEFAQKSIKKKRLNLVQQFQQALQSYDRNLDSSNFMVDLSLLKQLHDQEKVKAEHDFEIFMQDILSTGSTQEITNTTAMTKDLLQSDIKQEATSHLQIVSEKNQKLIQDFEIQVKKFSKSLADAYSEELKEIATLCLTEADFEEKASTAVEGTLLHFNIQCKSGTRPSLSIHLPPLRQELEEELKRRREQELVVVRLKIQQDENELKYAVPEVKKAYICEMDKIFGNLKGKVSLKDLSKYHVYISEMALDNYKLKNELPPSLEKQIQEELDVLHRGFREKIKRHNNKITPAIGIDLGTTYSCVAVIRNGQVEVIKNTLGDSTTPSYVHFPEGGRRPVVAGAKEEAFKDPENTVFDAKRLIGRKFTDQVIQDDIKFWPFKVVDEGNLPKIKIPEKIVSPEEIASYILLYLKQSADKRLDFPGGVKNVVITVPAYFSDAQRQATKDAGEIAGLNVLKIINEPTAAAIAYGLDYHDDLHKNVLIFDLGGGTFDVAVLYMKKGDIHVKTVGGDTHLGGEDFDNELVKYCLAEFKEKTSVDLLSADHKNKVLRRLRNECEKMKRQLSETETVNIRVEKIKDNYDLDVLITRETFEELCAPMFQKCIDQVEKTLQDAQLDKTGIDDIVLVGGSTRIPKIKEMLQKYFNGKTLRHTTSSDEIVAHGAAILACSLNPGQDENEEFSSLYLGEVTPFSLGTGIVGDKLSVIIPKNTEIPHTQTKQYWPASDNQTSILFKIYEGENAVASQNRLLGEFTLRGFPPAPAGQEKCDVTMELSSENILSVRAVGASKGNSESIKITSHTGRLSRDDIERIKSEIELARTKYKTKKENESPDKNYVDDGGDEEGGDDNDDDDDDSENYEDEDDF